MTTSSIIVQPPRAFQAFVTFVVGEDPRTDDELRAQLIASLTISLAAAPLVRQVGCARLATMPPQGPGGPN